MDVGETFVCVSIDNREGGGIGNVYTYIYIYGGCLTQSRDSTKVCESHNIDKQAKAVFVALEKMPERSWVLYTEFSINTRP